jgi:hypothetical protein
LFGRISSQKCKAAVVPFAVHQSIGGTAVSHLRNIFFQRKIRLKACFSSGDVEIDV